MNKIKDRLNGNRFIPVDGEEKTALELIKKVIDKSNDVIEQVNIFESEHNSVKDTVNSFDKKVELYNKNLNEYKEFVEKLPEINANAEVLDARCGKNTLGDFNRSISEQLETKANNYEVVKKGYATLNDFNEDTRKAILENNNININYVLGNGNVTNENIRVATIDENRLGYDYTLGLQKKNNLFNKNDVVDGFYITWDGGSLRENETYSVSNFIKVEPNTKYTINSHDQTTFYDVNNNFIGGLNDVENFRKQLTFVTPSDAVLMRVSLLTSTKDTVQICKGESISDYEDFGYEVALNNLANEVSNKLLYADDILRSDNILDLEKGKNLFDLSKITSGFYVSWSTGILKSNSSFSVSDFIRVNPSDTLAINKFNQVAFYDASKNFISGIDGYNVGEKVIEVPNDKNIYYIRVTVLNKDLEAYQLEKNSIVTEYNPYREPKVKLENLPNNIIPKQTIKSITHKLLNSEKTINIKLLGDSITHGVGGTGFKQDGEEFIANFKVNTKGFCWANLFKEYMEEKFNCTVTNYGASGRNAKWIVDNWNTLVKETDDILICMIGTNDRNMNANSSLQEYYNKMLNIYNLAQRDGKEIIFMACIPSTNKNEMDVNNPKRFHMEDVDNVIMAVNEVINKEYISLYKLFYEYCETRNVTIDSLLADGLHPNDEGYKVMFRLVCNQLGFATKIKDSTW